MQGMESADTLRDPSLLNLRFFLGPCLNFQGNREFFDGECECSPLSTEFAERDSDEDAENDSESSSVASDECSISSDPLDFRAGQNLGSGRGPTPCSLLYPNTQFITVLRGTRRHTQYNFCNTPCFLLDRSLAEDYMSEIVFPFRTGATTARAAAAAAAAASAAATSLLPPLSTAAAVLPLPGELASEFGNELATRKLDRRKRTNERTAPIDGRRREPTVDRPTTTTTCGEERSSN